MSFQVFNFKNLFVLDMANNHQGSVEHGKLIIDNCAEAVTRNNIRAGLKFQFRDLPDFISPLQRKEKSNKHVPRFLATKLEWSEFNDLKEYAANKGLVTICTPFDEKSVDKIIEMNFDIIKIASCSAADWPLLQKVAKANKPVICSTGGLTLFEIDKVVSFFTHNAVDFALMHCVSIYPTPDHECNLLDIKMLKERYRGTTIGWSTHEDQDEILPIAIVKALGAEMYERHVGVESEKIKLNAYSSNPIQLDNWFQAHQKTNRLLGKSGRNAITNVEKEALEGLQRGVFLKDDVKAGQAITNDHVYYAFPLEEGQVSSGNFYPGLILLADHKKDSILQNGNVKFELSGVESAAINLKHATYDVKALLNKANVTLNHMFKTEYSHHNGISNFRNVGTVLIEVLNREYAKKILVQLPGQSHPLHMHKLKEESFLILYGDLEIELDGRSHFLNPGDVLTVLPGIWHQFESVGGCVFEEISTTAYANDSYYKDNRIASMTSDQRKTVVDHWGRFQIQNQLL